MAAAADDDEEEGDVDESGVEPNDIELVMTQVRARRRYLGGFPPAVLVASVWRVPHAPFAACCVRHAVTLLQHHCHQLQCRLVSLASSAGPVQLVLGSPTWCMYCLGV